MSLTWRPNRQTLIVSAAITALIGVTILLDLLMPHGAHPNLPPVSNAVIPFADTKPIPKHQHIDAISASTAADYKFAGVWSAPLTGGFKISAVVYPMPHHAFIVECIAFNTRRPMIGCLLLKARLTTLHGIQYFIGQMLLPNLTRQTQNMVQLLKALHAAKNADKPILWALMRSTGRTGLGKVYCVVKLDAINADSLTVTPLFDMGLSSQYFSGEAILHPADLAAYVNSPTGRKLAAQPPLVLHRTNVSDAMPVGFYLTP